MIKLEFKQITTLIALGLAMAACGSRDHGSTLATRPDLACIQEAYNKKDSAYLKAERTYEYDMAGCYKLVDEQQQYLVFAKCEKAAKKAQVGSQAETDLRFNLDKQACTEVLAD